MSARCRYQAADVAAHIINRANSTGHGINNLQLQKLLYLCQCRSLQKMGTRLFDDDVVAWQYGPVVRDVYYAYAYRGASNIHESGKTVIDHRTNELRGIEPLEGECLAVVDEVYDAYGDWPVWSLVSRSRRRGGAWDRIYGDGSGYGASIPDSLMVVEPVL